MGPLSPSSSLCPPAIVIIVLEPQGQNVSKGASRASHGHRGIDVLRGKIWLETNFWCIRTRKLDWECDLWLSGCVTDLRKEEPLLPHSSNTHVKADYPHCESRGDVEGGFFFPPSRGCFRGLNTPTEQQRETRSDNIRGRNVKLSSRREKTFTLLLFQDFMLLGWQKWEENFSFSSSLSCAWA